jgi:GABA permease
MHNPLRSERDVFRAVVAIGIGAGTVIALALLTRPAFGAVLLAAEVALGIWVLWRRARGTLPHRAEVVRDEDDAHRVLVLANQTVGGRALLEEIKNRCQGRRSDILVVVPALTSTPLEHWASDVDEALAEARQRLEDSLRAMQSAGLAARGEVGDHHEPNAALEDALRYFAADEVIISTHPPDKSRWLERGVVDRARSEVPLPITHVVVDLDAEAAGAAGTAETAA